MKTLISILTLFSLLLQPQTVQAQTCNVVSSNPPTVIYIGTLTQWNNVIAHVTNGCSFTFRATIRSGGLEFTAVSTTTSGTTCSLAIDLKSIECHGRPLINNLNIMAVVLSNSVGQSLVTTNLNGAPSEVIVQTINYPIHIFLPEIQ